MAELLGVLLVIGVILLTALFVVVMTLFFYLMHKFDKQDKALREKLSPNVPWLSEPPPPPKGPGPRNPHGKR